MVEGWEWDRTLFLGAAPYYRRGRLPYAQGLPELLAGVIGLDGRGRLLDVGCGPGTLALALAHLFGDVVGLDPDAGMLAEAQRLEAERHSADGAASGGVRWVQARAEELPAGLGAFTVATFGQSFHWMDQDLVAAVVLDMLAPGGALVHVADLKTGAVPVTDLPSPAVPYSIIQDLTVRHLGPVRRAGRGVLPHGTPSGEAAVLTRAGFAGPERHVVAGGEVLERSYDDVVAWVFSQSSSAPHLFGERRDAFEADLVRLLREASPSGRFAERQPDTEVFVWHKPTGQGGIAEL